MTVLRVAPRLVGALLIMSAVSACAPYNRSSFIHPDLAPFVQSFEQDCGVDVGYAVVLTDHIPKGLAGLCRRYTNGGRSVKISKSYWQRASTWAKHQLVYHELGHCSLDLDHDNSTVSYNGIDIPISIMYYKVFGAREFYQLNIQYYVNQLCPR